MRKVLIIALASFGVLAVAQVAPANASCVTTCVGWGLVPEIKNGKTTLIPYCRHPQKECAGQGPGPVQPIQQSKLRRLN